MCAIKYILALKKKHYPLYAALTISFAIIVCIVNLGMTSPNQSSSNSDLTSSKSSSSVTKNQTAVRANKNSDNRDTDSVKKSTSAAANKNNSKSVKTVTDTDLNNQNAGKTKSAKKTEKSSKKIKLESKTKSRAADTSYLSTTPKSYKINGVVHYNQNPEMPTGCEIVSAKTVLSYYGVELTYDDMLKHIQRADLKMTKKGKLYGKTPFEAFIGNPKRTSGFGCYPPVIMDMIED